MAVAVLHVPRSSKVRLIPIFFILVTFIERKNAEQEEFTDDEMDAFHQEVAIMWAFNNHDNFAKV
jgi:hypothetical protein